MTKLTVQLVVCCIENTLFFQTYNHREKNLTQACSLLMTSDHILTVREAFSSTINSLLPLRSKHEPIKGAQALSCASIIDLTAFRLPSSEQSWCILVSFLIFTNYKLMSEIFVGICLSRGSRV